MKGMNQTEASCAGPLDEAPLSAEGYLTSQLLPIASRNLPVVDRWLWLFAISIEVPAVLGN